jgi:hypothetical protein
LTRCPIHPFLFVVVFVVVCALPGALKATPL